MALAWLPKQNFQMFLYYFLKSRIQSKTFLNNYHKEIKTLFVNSETGISYCFILLLLFGIYYGLVGVLLFYVLTL